MRSLAASHRLAQRITAMGKRWGYSPAELQAAVRDAAKDHDGWEAVVEWDEAHHKRCQRAGVKPAIA
jgi:hypothetical protein